MEESPGARPSGGGVASPNLHRSSDTDGRDVRSHGPDQQEPRQLFLHAPLTALVSRCRLRSQERTAARHPRRSRAPFDRALR